MPNLSKRGIYYGTCQYTTEFFRGDEENKTAAPFPRLNGYVELKIGIFLLTGSCLKANKSPASAGDNGVCGVFNLLAALDFVKVLLSVGGCFKLDSAVCAFDHVFFAAV